MDILVVENLNLTLNLTSYCVTSDMFGVDGHSDMANVDRVLDPETFSGHVTFLSEPKTVDNMRADMNIYHKVLFPRTNHGSLIKQLAAHITKGDTVYNYTRLHGKALFILSPSGYILLDLMFLVSISAR